MVATSVLARMGSTPATSISRRPSSVVRASDLIRDGTTYWNLFNAEVDGFLVQRWVLTCHSGSKCRLRGCAVIRRRSSVGASPTRQLSLRPEAIGAVMEVTKWLKPLV